MQTMDAGSSSDPFVYNNPPAAAVMIANLLSGMVIVFFLIASVFSGVTALFFYALIAEAAMVIGGAALTIMAGHRPCSAASERSVCTPSA
jgi:hypothetical protein